MRPSLSRPGRARQRRVGGWCLGAALLCALLPRAAGAQAAPGDTASGTTPAEECCKELLFPLGGRIVALGRAVVADTAPDAVLFNPAGLVGLRHAFFEVHYRKLVADAQIVGISYVTRPYSFGTFALSYTLVDQGSIETAGTDPNAPTGETFRQVHEISATFATALAAGVSSGVTYRVFVANSPCNGCATGGASGTTQLIDLGLQYHPRAVRGLAFGAALVNAGIPLQIVNYEQSDRTPVRARVGATLEFMHLIQRDTTLSGTISGQLDAGGPDGMLPAVGAQVTVADVISIRGGWHAEGASAFGSLDSGATLGVGLKLQRFSLSVARALAPAVLDSESPFQVTFGMSF